MNSSNQKHRKSLVYSEIFPPFHGGSGRWFWEVYRRLEVSDYVVLAGKTDGDVDFDKKSPLFIERFDFNYSSWSHWALTSIKSLTFYWNLFFATRAVVKKHHITDIHCGRCIPEGFIAYLLKKFYKIPYMCYIHGEDIESAAESRAFVWIVSRALKHADLLICNSENSKKLLLAHWNVDAARVVVVNPGVCLLF
jgi:phosphatidylinositol alpha-1,6-mannosyltransferase